MPDFDIRAYGFQEWQIQEIEEAVNIDEEPVTAANSTNATNVTAATNSTLAEGN